MRSAARPGGDGLDSIGHRDDAVRRLERGRPAMADLAFVLLTIGLFVVLGVLAKGVEKL